MIALCGALALIALISGLWAVRKRRRHRHRPPDVLRRVFRSRELRALDKHLERIAVEEVRRLELSALRYVAGDAGYVVVISDSRDGVGLGLSDGHRLELAGVSRYTLRLLKQEVAAKRLRPAHLKRDGFSYRLLLRGEAGAEVEIFARGLTLAL